MWKREKETAKEKAEKKGLDDKTKESEIYAMKIFVEKKSKEG